MRTKLIPALLALVLALVIPVSSAWAKGDLDEIVNYTITVDVNDDATLNMVYHIEWKVLDSTSEGPLTWVKIGIPNNHYVSMEALSETIKKISYSPSGGSYARIDLDKAYAVQQANRFFVRATLLVRVACAINGDEAHRGHLDNRGLGLGLV